MFVFRESQRRTGKEDISANVLAAINPTMMPKEKNWIPRSAALPKSVFRQRQPWSRQLSTKA